MIKLSKRANTFILLTLGLGYLFLGFLMMQGESFSALIQNPIFILVLLIGLLTPFISAIITKLIVDKISFKDIVLEIITVKNKKKVYLVLLLLAMHYIIAILLGFVGQYGDISSFITLVPMMLLIFGLSEYGWRSILFVEVRKKMGFYKSNVVTGLFMAVWLIPLVFIPGFMIGTNVFIPFAAYLVGISLLSTTIYLQSDSILLSMIFVGVFAAVSAVISLEIGNALLIMFVVDLIIAVAYNAKALNKSVVTIGD